MRVAGMGATLLTGILLARSLGAEGMGVYGLVMSVVAFAMVAAELGLTQLATREIARTAADSIRGFIFWCWSRFGMLCVAVAAVMVLAGWLVDSLPVSLFAAGAFVAIASSGGNLAEACLRGFQDMTKGQIGQLLLRPLFFAIMMGGWLMFNQTMSPLQALTLGAVAAFVTFLLSGWWLGRKALALKPGAAALSSRSDWWRAALPMAGTELLRIAQQHLVILILGMFAALNTVGEYRVAVSLIPVFSLPTVVANIVLAPRIAKLHADGNTEALRKLLPVSALVTLGASLAMILPMVFAGQFLLALVFGSEFTGSYAPLMILCAATAVVAACGPCGAILNMTGNEEPLMKATYISLMVIIVLAFILIPRSGDVGAAGAYAAGLCLWTALMVRYIRKFILIDPTVWGLMRFVRGAKLV